jgi:hypothetical protein
LQLQLHILSVQNKIICVFIFARPVVGAADGSVQPQPRLNQLHFARACAGGHEQHARAHRHVHEHDPRAPQVLPAAPTVHAGYFSIKFNILSADF